MLLLRVGVSHQHTPSLGSSQKQVEAYRFIYMLLFFWLPIKFWHVIISKKIDDDVNNLFFWRVDNDHSLDYTDKNEQI